MSNPFRSRSILIRGVGLAAVALVAALMAQPATAQVPACPAINTFDAEGNALYNFMGIPNGWGAGDYDQNGMVDNFEVGLVAHILCNQRHGRWAETRVAFDQALAKVRAEPEYNVLQPYENVIAVLTLVSSQMRDTVVTGLNLTGSYVPFTYDNQEVYSRNGNFSFDNATNFQRYQLALSSGGGRDLYITLASRPEGFYPQFLDALSYLYTFRINIFGLVDFTLIGEDPLTTDLILNGMKDYAQALLFDQYARWADHPGWFTVREAWINNEFVVKEITNQIPTIIWIALDRGRVERALNGLVTQNGPLGVAAVVAFVELIEQDLHCCIDFDPADFDLRGEAYVGARGDADGDGYCNLSEYLVQPEILPGFEEFVRNALNPDVTLSANACGEPEQNNGEQPTFCPIWPTLDSQGEAFYASRGHDWFTADLNGNGMIDRWELALVADILCDFEYPDNFGTRQRFTGNFERLQMDDNTVAVGTDIFVVAGLMTSSSNMASYWKSQFSLSGFYYPYTRDGDEALGPFGDLDDDGLTNRSEYNRVIDRGGTVEEYVLAAKTPAGGNVDRCLDQCGGPGGGPCPPRDFAMHMRNVDQAIEPFRDQIGGYVFAPGSADINGGLDLENNEPLPNGILDVDEFALLNYFFLNPNIDMSATGGPVSSVVCSAYQQNVAQMTADLGGPSGLINVLAPDLKFLAAAYMTLGDENSVGSIVFALTEASKVTELPLNVSVPNLNNYHLLPQWFAFDADPDSDGFTNLEEYECFRLRSQCCYILAALDPDLIPEPSQCVDLGDLEGEPEGEGEEPEGEFPEGEPEGEGEGGEFVDPCDTTCVETCDGVAIDAQAEASGRAALSIPLLEIDPDTSDADENGILDLLHLRLLDAVLADPTLPIHCCVANAYNNNVPIVEAYIEELKENPLADVILAFITEEEIRLAVTALVTIGEEATFNIVADGLNELPGVPPLDLNAFDRSSERFLAYNGDADGDGICNLGEYNAWVEAGIEDGDLFITAALDPEITVDGGGCPPCVGDPTLCVLPLTGSQSVPPVTTNASGEVKFEETEEGTVIMTVTHDVVSPTAATIRLGGPGQSAGAIVFNLGSPVSPVVAELSVSQYDIITDGTHHLAIHSESFLAGEIRADLVCGDFEGEPEGEGEGGIEGEGSPEGLIEGQPEGEGEEAEIVGVLCQTQLTGAAMVPPTESSATANAVFYLLSDGNVLLEVEHNVAGATALFVRPGLPGATSFTSLVTVTSVASPIQTVISAEIFGQIDATAHYMTIHSTNFLSGEIRGDIDCDAVFEGEPEGVPVEGEGDVEGEGEGIEGEGDLEGEGEGIEGEGDLEGEGEGLEGEGHEGEEIRTIHSADQTGDNVISLSELLRVIQFFNSGSFGCDANSEDGYSPSSEDRSCRPHSSDYNPQDWTISLSELLRLIQFFNAGGYHRCDTGEDGYCPGLPAS